MALEYNDKIGLIYDSVTLNNESKLLQLVESEGYDVKFADDLDDLIELFLNCGFTLDGILKRIESKRDFIIRCYYDNETYKYYMLCGYRHDSMEVV